MRDKELQELLDKRALDELIYGQAIAVDTQDWQAYRACFHDDLELDIGGHMEVAAGEGDGKMRGGDQVVATVRKVMTGFDSYQHYVTNPVHKVAGDTAMTRAYVLGYHLLNNDRGDRQLVVGGIYNLKCVRTANGWKIRSWGLNILWYSGNSALYQLATQRAQANPR